MDRGEMGGRGVRRVQKEEEGWGKRRQPKLVIHKELQMAPPLLTGTAAHTSSVQMEAHQRAFLTSKPLHNALAQLAFLRVLVIM